MKEESPIPKNEALPWLGWKKKSVCQYLLVLAMAAFGVAMTMAGLLAWVVGEPALLMAGVTGGSIFIAAGALGMLRCLDGRQSP